MGIGLHPRTPSDAAGANGRGLPCQVQMRIVSAPAEICIPTKKDRTLTPHFQVQVGLLLAAPVLTSIIRRWHIHFWYAESL